MKLKFIILITLILGTINIPAQINSYNSNTDTLILASKKVKGKGLFDISYSTKPFKDTLSWMQMERFHYYPDYPIKYPPNIQDMKFGFIIKMFDTLRYYDFNSQQVLKQNNFNLSDREIPMITGQIDNMDVLIIDQNDNKDLTDDSIRHIAEWDGDSEKQLISCKYFIENNNSSFFDTSWIKLGKVENRIVGTTSQYLISDFSIDRVDYRIGIVDENSTSFCFFRPILHLLSENGAYKDTILKKNVIELGEYINLGKHFYKFDYLYNGNGAFMLVREKTPDNVKIAQTGFRLPDFTCITIDNDTLNKAKLFKDKPVLIANISGCFPDAYNLLKEIEEKCGKSINIIWLEYEVNKKWKGKIVDTSIEYNNDVYLKFRNAYSSYTCYLIDTNQKIIDEFHLFDWKKNLIKYIKN